MNIVKAWRPVGRPAMFIATLLPNPVLADKVEYTGVTDSVPRVEIRSNAPEGDALIRAICLGFGMVELRLGAEFDVGAGKGEAVTVTLKSAGKAANVSGASLQSIDSPMTGSSELLATVRSADAIFSVLASGAAIRFSGSIKGAQSVSIGADATKSLKKFLASCKA